MNRLLRALLLFISTIGLAQTKSNETVYFLVSAPRWGDCALVFDSYVLPLTNQEDIAHARYLISLGCTVFEDPPKHSLVSAKVGPGKDGINRDYLNPTFPAWSWHIVQFLAFADYSLDIFDGS